MKRQRRSPTLTTPTALDGGRSSATTGPLPAAAETTTAHYQSMPTTSLSFTPGFRAIFIMVVAIFLAWTRPEKWGVSRPLVVVVLLVLVVLGLFALCHAMNERLPLEEKQDIRYNIMEAEDVLHEMEQVEQVLTQFKVRQQQQQQQQDSGLDFEAMIREGEILVLSGLGALAKKYGRQKSLLKMAGDDCNDDDCGRNNNDQTIQRREYHNRQVKERKLALKVQREKRLLDLAVLCQRAAYVGFCSFPEKDPILAASLSLLALVAKQPIVRDSFHCDEHQDRIGLIDRPIQCLKDALERAKDTPVNDDDDDDSSNSNSNTVSPPEHHVASLLSSEQQCAELQRKGCLLLGALADGDARMARLVAAHGGIPTILQAADWYRYHSAVANWALWALFVLVSEHAPNKAVLVECHGVAVVIRALRNCVDSVSVVRHGLALLFDLMREQQHEGNDGDVRLLSSSAAWLDVGRIRHTALNEGIHEVVVRAMEEYPSEIQVVMMGQAILVGTDYTGEIPEYQQHLSGKN